MLLLMIIIFLLVALGGIFLISFILRDKNTPKGIAIIHGGAGASGILLLAFYCLLYKPVPILPLVLFILAASIGIILLHQDLSKNNSPKKLALLHGIIALLAFISLIYFAWQLR